ncbi:MULTISPECIES: ferredoxin reductase family protein [Microbacterium]|jgi:predicted ferric reductase|uniref:ferredoxin reductase family protein n=1 Tax=Microbacterium TaxID=33882 RepID=UPI001D1775BC|nr:ferric reductase-like transmembrane domain-containing protein [Microbacterium testaceum]MCC4249919.1 ferric reductase-like transmembrane domain-containing protein [Microbacterium testaceum]
MTATTTVPVPAGLVATRRERSRVGRPHARLVWHLAATAIIWLTSLVVVALWVAGGGLQALIALDAETLNTFGRLSGLVSANLLLYQVLLMARVPVFERGFGRDGIARMHRFVGFWSFWLFSAHIVLQTLGYAATAGINPFVQLWEFVWDYPGMLLATAGTLLLLLVVATSIRRARRRLRYESWHLLHLYGYLGVGLAVPHMLWTGADFTAHPLASVYWWALWGATAVAVLVFRVGLPLARSLRHDLRVSTVARDGDRGVAVTMAGRGLHRMPVRAGQFFVWRFLDGPGWTRGHPFSLAAAPDGRSLTVAARLVGDGTHRLASLRPGTRVLIEGPYGEMTADVRIGRKLLLIGAGAGVAPLIALAEEAAWAPGEATLLVRDHAEGDALRRGEIARLERDRGLRYAALVGPRAPGVSPWLPAGHAGWKGADLLRYVAPDLDQYDVFLCGPGPWMDAVRADLRRAGVASTRIHAESFTV